MSDLGRVFIVDADPESSGTLRTLLEKDGYAVETAAGGEDARDAIPAAQLETMFHRLQELHRKIGQLDISDTRLEEMMALGRTAGKNREQPSVSTRSPEATGRRSWRPGSVTGVRGRRGNWRPRW